MEKSLYQSTLDQIAIKHGTDKSSLHHGYTKHYEKFFEPIRDKPITLFECGYGGYQYPDRGGEGAKTWREYFSNAVIVSTDLYPKNNVPAGVNFHQGLQNNVDFWSFMLDKYAAPDIFIDDASHINTLTIQTFNIIFQCLRPGSIYVIEDLESSWWEEIASDGTDFGGCVDHNNFNASTAINFLRVLINDVNVKHIKGLDYKGMIESIHFYENISFIIKK